MIKKVGYIFLIFICFFAIEVKSKTVRLEYINNNNYIIKGGGSDQSIKRYKVTMDGVEYPAFCRNPHLVSAITYNTGISFGATYSEMNVGKLSINNPYDAGLIAIFKESKMSNSSSYDTFANVNVALRVYENMWKNKNSNRCNNSSSELNYYIYLAKKYMNDGSIQKTGLEKELGTINYCSPQKEYKSSDFNLGGINESVVKNYVQIAFRAATSVKKGNLPDNIANVDVKEEMVNRDELKYTIKLTGDLKTSDIKFAYSCANCANAVNGTKVTVKYGSKTEEILNVNQELSLKKYFANNKEISVHVKYDVKENCAKVNYNVKITYPSNVPEVYVLNPSVNNTQNFYIVQSMYGGNDMNGYDSKNFSGKPIMKCNCDDIERKCNETGKDKNSDECKYFKEEYNETCYKCEIKGDPVVCNPTDTEIKIEEGYGYEVKNGNATSNKEKNIFACIIGNSDANGNSYQDTKLGSKYCSVYCKEDYKFTVPGVKSTKTGSQFKINVDVTGTKTCYTSEIDLKQYEIDARVNKATADEELNKCINWSMNYEINPEMDVRYFDNDGELYKSYGAKSLKEESKNVGEVVSEQCSYVDPKTYDNCRASGNTNPKYVKKSITINKRYSTENLFCQKYTSGVVTIGNCNYKNAKQLEGLAVPFSTETGYYDYKITFKNVGEYYSNNQYGRIWGGNDKTSGLVEKAIKENKIEAPSVDKNGVEYACKYGVNIEGCANYDCGNGTSPDTICKSKNGGSDKTLKELRELYPGDNNCPKCPDCPINIENNCAGKTSNKCCVNPDGKKYVYGKSVNDEEFDKQCGNDNCPNCPLFYSNKRNFTFKPVSTGNVNPSSRTMGKNWRYDEKIDTALELKAGVTTKQIEKSEEYIYDTENNKVNSDNRNVSVTVKLDTSVISKIKKYNKNAEKAGGYYNDSLTCYDYKGEDGNTYANLFCYSDFIDHIFSGENASKLKVNGATRPVSDVDRGNPGTYWTTWTPKYVQDAMKQSGIAFTTERILDYTQQYKEIGVGPSWK